MKRGFVAFGLAAALLGALIASAAINNRAIERSRDYSRLMLSLQQLKAIREDVKGTMRQVLESAEGRTTQEKVFDAATKLVLAEKHLEEKYVDNGLDLGFGACGPGDFLDLSAYAETWEGEAAPLVASMFYGTDSIVVSPNGRSFFKDAPLLSRPCIKGKAFSGNAEYGFDLNEFD